MPLDLMAFGCADHLQLEANSDFDCHFAYTSHRTSWKKIVDSDSAWNSALIDKL
jgi:hypothetical protein